MSPEESAALHSRLDRHEQAQYRLTASHDDMRHDLASMRVELTANTEVTTEVRDILTSAKGFFRGASAFGKFFGWIGAFVSACLAVWGAIWVILHGGKPT